jgi:hypothetical protein
MFKEMQVFGSIAGLHLFDTEGRRERVSLQIWFNFLDWEDNIKMDLRDIGFGNVDWIYLAQDRDRWRVLVNMVMNLRVP